MFLGFNTLAFSQTEVAISEFRYANNSLDLRVRPVFYFMNSASYRHEIFVGKKFNKKTTLFSYSQYNYNNNSFKTGFRLDHKLFLNKITINNQFRYLKTLNNKGSDFFAYITDLFFPTVSNIKIGARSFLIYTNNGEGFINSKKFIGPSLFYSKKKYSIFLNYLPDRNKNSDSYFLLLMLIIKING